MDNSETGGIDSSGNIISGNNLWRSNVYIEVEPNTTYTLSRKIFNDNLSRVIRLYEYDNNKTFISPRKESSTESLIITTTANTKYLKWTIFELNATLTKSTVQAWLLQLELGTATTYTPHQQQTFIFPLGNEKLMLGDYLADDGIHHVRGQVVFDGSENWLANGETTDYGQYVYLLNTKAYGTTNLISDKFLTKTGNNGNYISGRDSNKYISISIAKNIVTYGANQFKTWLSTHNVTVEYELEEEVIVPYTSAQQRVYNEIKNAYSYDEMTIITGSSDGNKPFFIVQTYKDLNKELNNKVDKVQGKELSSNDFTDTLKEKLEGLENYDDTEIKADISDIQDEQTEQNEEIEKLQEENARLKATLPTTGEVTGQAITLNKTAELEFKKPPLPMGNSEQESTTGKNLLDKQYFENGSIDGTTGQDIANDYNGRGNNYIPVLPNTTYTLSANTIITNLRLSEYTNDKTHIQRNSIDRNSKLTITTTANTYFLRWSLNYNNSTIVTQEIINSIDLQLEQGSATEYEPYTGGEASPNPDYPQEITNVTGDVEVKVQNKNLLKYPYSNTTLTTKGITYTDNGDGSITINGTATGDAYFNIYSNSSGNRLKLQKGSYIVSANENVPAGITATFAPRNSDGSSISGVSNMYLNSSNRIINQTINQDFEMFASIQVASGTTVNNYIFKPMFEKGTTSTPYTPHKEQVFTFPLGNEKLMLGDYLADDGIHHVRGQDVLNGSENWGNLAQIGTSDYYRYENVDFRTNNCLEHSTYLSDKFIYSTNTMQQANVIGNSNAVGANRLWITIDTSLMNGTTINDFKTWLSTHNVTVEYELEEEVIIPYNSAQQEVYNQIKQALSYEEQTNISSNTIALFNVEAYQSTKLVLEEMATAIVALGGV